MAIFQEPMERLTKILSASATVTTEQLRKYGTFSITGSSATITLPTPSENNCGLAVVFVNNTSGSVTLSCSSGFVQAGSSITIESANSQLVYSMKVDATTYKWITFGVAGAIAGLQETVEDYIDGLMTSGTMVAWTYDDAGGTGEFSLVDDSITLAKLANVGTSGDPLVSGGTGANPSYTTLGVSGGGTGAVTLTDHGVVLGSGTSAVTVTAAGTAGQPLLSGGSGADPDWGTLGVAYGGSGATSLTDHGVLVGSGTTAVTALTVGTDGQVLVGSTGADPVFATITAGDGLDSTLGAGTLALAADIKANSGIVIDTGEISLDLGASAITGTLAVGDGGSGATSLSDHGVLVGSGTNPITAIAPATNGQVLVGSTGADPVFANVTAGDGLSATEGAGTLEFDVDLKTNGGLVIETNQLAVDLGASAITGTLAVGDGGTGAATLTDHGVLLGSGTSAVTVTGAGTAGQALLSGGAGADPDWGTLSVAYGGTGATTLTNHGVLLGQATSAVAATTAGTAGEVLTSGGAAADPSWSSVGITSVTSGVAWVAYSPTVTWTSATAPASVTSVARYSRTWNTVDFVVDLSGADGDDAVIEGITIPVASATTADFPVVAQALVNTTYSQPYGLIEKDAFARTTVTVNGGFGADSDWDKGAGWSIGAGVATHLTANATALNETVSTVVSGVTYRLTYTTTVTDGGTLTPSAGGVTLTGRTTADTFVEDFTATSTAALTFTADATWGGTIDNVSLQPLTPVGVIFRAPVTCTNAQPWHIKVYGRYEVV